MLPSGHVGGVVFKEMGNYSSRSSLDRQNRKNYRDFKREFLLDPVYQALSSCPIFCEVPKRHRVEGCYLDVDMDCYAIADASKRSLATTEVFSCFTICCRGTTKEYKIYLGLSHISNLYSLEDVIKGMHQKMKQNECLDESIEFYILGGKVITDDADCTHTHESMHEAIGSVKSLKDVGIHIAGVRFNDSRDINLGFHVLLTAQKIYFSTQHFFISDLNKCEVIDSLLNLIE